MRRPLPSTTACGTVARWEVRAASAGPAALGLALELWVGDIASAPADAVCTSTNPRLTLLGGSGRAVVGEAGWEVEHEARRIVEAALAGGARGLPLGSAHVTGAGALPYRAIIHCVAADHLHRSSPAVVRRCVESALVAAAGAGCRSLALPVLGTGHAGLPFGDAVDAIVAALRDSTTTLERVVLVLLDGERATGVARRIDAALARA